MFFTKPSSGMFKKFRGINSLVTPVDTMRYRELLPDQFELPDTPQASMFIAHYQKVFPWPMTSYFEGAILLKCIYERKEYWYTYTMPVTKYVPMWGGRKMGFPKYIADSIVFENDGVSWLGKVTHQQGTKLSLRFTPGVKAKPNSTEKVATQLQSFFFDDAINLVPPSQGPKVITVGLVHKVEPRWNPVFGMVRIECDRSEDHHGLFEDGREYFGFYNEFEGGINLDPVCIK